MKFKGLSGLKSAFTGALPAVMGQNAAKAVLKGLVVVLLLALQQGTWAQTITGSIVGSVTDPSGLAVSGATVTLTQITTGSKRNSQTLITGDFAFSALEPGSYQLQVESSGFKKAERTSLNLTASARLSAGVIVLEVGSASESVTVKADAAVVQTASSEHAGVMTQDQVDNLAIKGRNIVTLLQLLPGVVDTNAPDSPDRNFAIGLSVNGNRRNAVGMWMDGLPTQDSGLGWIATANVSPDAVAEVKVLLNNYQAEYGRMRGAGVQLVGKSGTKEFHGSFSYFKRHEQFNANNFFNNRNRLANPRYRYNTFSYTIGGPIYIPGKFNSGKNKLFFFFSQEFWPQKVTNPVSRVTMPTALEIAGDFSQSFDANNKLIVVKDPQTGNAFPGNVIPSTRLDPNGQAVLKMLPSPNYSDLATSLGQYNYLVQTSLEKPTRLNTLKVDYNVTDGDRISVTWSQQLDKQTGSQGLATPSASWPYEFRTFQTLGNLASLHYQKTISPSLINEVVLGYNYRHETETVPQDQLDRVSRSPNKYGAPQLFPAANPENLLPNFSFGGNGISNAPTLTHTNIPYGGKYPTYNLTDNVTKVMGRHIFKAGVYYNRPSFIGQASSDPGSINFSTDVNNPLDTGYTYANAVLGVFASASQTSRIVQPSQVYPDYEWFVQDSWKVSKRLTLELGIRFIYAPPAYTNHPAAAFVLSNYNPAQAAKLIAPTLVNGKRMGINPATGEIYPALTIGQLAPGSGNFANGIVLSASGGVPRGFLHGAGVQYEPRFGFAWDVFGNARTAVHGGFAVNKSAGATGEGFAGGEFQYPLVSNVSVPYSTLSSLGNAGGLLSPNAVSYWQDPMGVATSYNMSLGIQQNIGFGTVVEVSYVGTLGRHLLWSFDKSVIPVGANFDAKNLDPTTGKVLQPNFLRPLVGYGGVSYLNWGGSSNYHSLQTTVNRRFSKGLQFGASWTWSKYMNTGDNDSNGVSPFIPARIYNYGESGSDRTHNLRMNWLYDLPKVGWKNMAAKWVVNGWQLSGINGFISGAPYNVGFSTTTGVDITGTSSSGARIDVIGDPYIPKGDRTFYHTFNLQAFALPAVGTLGNGGRSYLRGPGINNWDLSLYKNFPIREPMRLQFRLEMFNAFNHTQFSGLNSSIQFDPAGVITTSSLAATGNYTGARAPRQMQMALRFNF